MPATINLEPRTSRTANAHRVYLRSSWNTSWTRIPWLFAEEVSWQLAPGISTAALSWQYGFAMRQSEITPHVVARLTDRRRQYVKIEIDAHRVTADELSGDESPKPLRWYGTIELDGRVREGLFAIQNNQYVDRGDQPLAAVGLEQALYRHPVRGATFLDADGSPRRADRPYVFNRPNAAGEPVGNRSTARGERSYLFSSQVYGADKIWNTRTIVEYLAANEVPKGAGGLAQWLLFVHEDYRDFLPDWDQPVIDTRDRTVGDLLNLLLPRTRMLSWYLLVEPPLEGFTTDTVKLVPVSLFGENVPTDLGNFPGNPMQVALQATVTGDGSPELIYQLKESDVPRIDQARVRGARRTSTCTLSKADSTIDEGWSLELELAYIRGFTYDADGNPNPDYDGLSKVAKQVANAEVRESDRLHAVMRRFAIPESWDQKVKDGLNGGSKKAVFLDDPSVINLKRVCPRDIELAPTLALLEGYDYSNIGSPTFRIPPVKVYDSAEARLPALVLFKDPTALDPGDYDEADRYMQVEKIGVGGRIPIIEQNYNRAWSGRVEIPQQDRAVLIHVQGQPQHVLAYTDFEALPVDEDLGRWDWRDALFTVTIYDDRFAEGVYPADAAADDGVANMRRELLVDAGSAYRLDYLVPGTVIGVNPTTRGLTRNATGGWINDDRKLLTARAKQLYEYYGQTRRTLTLDTRIVTSQLSLGSYVVNFGRSGAEREVGTVISEVRITIPGGDNARLPPPSVRYTTAFAELEPIELLNRPHVKYHVTREHVPIHRIGAAGPVRP